MRIFNSHDVRTLVTMPELVGALQEAFRQEIIAPLRQVAEVPGGEGNRFFLSMPAFSQEGMVAVKLVTVFPDNQAKKLPTVQAVIVVFSEAGAPEAVLDGTVVTHLRTGAASALASRYLSREDSSHLVVVGTGALAPSMAAAHCAVRPIRRVSVCGRRRERAAATAANIRSLVSDTVEVVVSDSIEDAVATADIISCATTSSTPVLRGKWLKPGAFVDLVGSYSPRTREADDETMVRSRVFIDTREGALAEAGDILDPLERGVITKEKVEGDLSDLVRGRVKGRMASDEITLFKSVGTALEDLAAAKLILAAANRRQ